MLGKILFGVAVFTAIELVALALWLVGSGVHITTFGEVALALVLYLEHFVSVLVGLNVGAGRPLFTIPS